jgi:hypothetical protein
MIILVSGRVSSVTITIIITIITITITITTITITITITFTITITISRPCVYDHPGECESQQCVIMIILVSVRASSV